MKTRYLSYVSMLKVERGLEGKKKNPTCLNKCANEDFFCENNYFMKDANGVYVLVGE